MKVQAKFSTGHIGTVSQSKKGLVVTWEPKKPTIKEYDKILKEYILMKFSLSFMAEKSGELF